MLKIAVTGGIASGKSYVLSLMQACGIPVYNADHIVADLYANDMEVIQNVAKIVPNAVLGDCVDKNILRQTISQNPNLLKDIEKIVHPAVRQKQDMFFDTHRQVDFVVLEIPLLFEVNKQAHFDIVIMVYVTSSIQWQRIQESRTMTQRDFLTLSQRQKPSADKMIQSDYIIDSSHGRGLVCKQVDDLIELFRYKARRSLQ